MSVVVIFYFSTRCGGCDVFKKHVYNEILSKLYDENVYLFEYTAGVPDQDPELIAKIRLLPYPTFTPCMIVLPKIVFDTLAEYPLYEVVKTMQVYGGSIQSDMYGLSAMYVADEDHKIDANGYVKLVENFRESREWEYRNAIKKHIKIALYPIKFIRNEV